MSSMFVLVAHFHSASDPVAVVSDAGGAAPVEPPLDPEVRAALTLLAMSPDCRRMSFARSTDNAGRHVLIAEFDTAAAYRRVLSPFEARTVLVPWLSTAEYASSGVSEVLVSAVDGRLVEVTPTVIPPRS